MIVLGYDRELSLWASSRLGISPFQNSVAIGVAHGGKIAAVAVFDLYSDPDIRITFVTESARWASPGAVSFILGYPFRQLGVKRLTAITEASNQRARAFLCRLGFKQEGIHPDLFPSGEGISYGLLRKDAEKWLKEERVSGQIDLIPSSSGPGSDRAGAGRGERQYGRIAGRA